MLISHIKNNPNQLPRILHERLPKHTDFTGYGGHDELVELAQPQDFTGYGQDAPLPQYLPVDVAYGNHYDVPHHGHGHAHTQYGPPPQSSLTPYSHITNYINTERKGK